MGTTGAGLWRWTDGGPVRVESFERMPGRDGWYTPWGDPPDTRSIAEDAGGPLYVNVHVGGVARSTDGGASWSPTIDVDADVHQVVAHETCPGYVFAAAAEGLWVSADGGDSWATETEGLHARYCRAVALTDDAALVSASTGPGGRRAALYRLDLDGGPLRALSRRSARVVHRQPGHPLPGRVGPGRGPRHRGRRRPRLHRRRPDVLGPRQGVAARPRRGPPLSRLRLVSANLAQRTDPAAFARLVADLDADVVAVQELVAAQAEALAAVLPFGRLDPARDYTGHGHRPPLPRRR